MSAFNFSDRARYAVDNWLGNPLKNNNKYPTFKDKYNLTADEFFSLLESSKLGNFEAAVRVANFYHFTKLDPSEAKRWELLAAHLGSPITQYTVACDFLESGDVVSAELWAIKSQAGGCEDATSLLETINIARGEDTS